METVILAGKTLALDADGNLANRNDWNEDIAREVAAIGTGCLEHRVEILKDTERLLFAFRQPRVRRSLCKHVRRDSVDEVLRHQPGRENPAARACRMTSKSDILRHEPGVVRHRLRG